MSPVCVGCLDKFQSSVKIWLKIFDLLFCGGRFCVAECCVWKMTKAAWDFMLGARMDVEEEMKSGQYSQTNQSLFVVCRLVQKILNLPSENKHRFSGEQKDRHSVQTSRYYPWGLEMFEAVVVEFVSVLLLFPTTLLFSSHQLIACDERLGNHWLWLLAEGPTIWPPFSIRNGSMFAARSLIYLLDHCVISYEDG